MLNSEDLAQLKIQALVDRQKGQNLANSYFDLTNILTSSSRNFYHFFIHDSPNSNIIGFSHILLSQMLDNKRDFMQSNYVSSSQNYESSGSGSINYDRRNLASGNKGKQKEECTDPRQKLYFFLLSEQIDLSKITNLPENINKIMAQFKVQANLHIKKMLFQFLNIVQIKNQDKRKSSSSNNHQSSHKSQIIFSLFHSYPVCQTLFAIFMRGILYYQYQIAEALDFTASISDHTVYAALCDAFNYSSLHMEQNYTQISPSFFIRSLKIKPLEKRSNVQNTHLVSIPKNKQIPASAKQFLGDTFRGNRKSSDHTSNNQSVSFRQNSKHIYQPNKQESSKILEQSFQKNDSKEFITEIFEEKGLEKSRHSEQSEKEILQEGYTSIQILRQLHPRFRQSILTKIDHFRKTRPI